MFSRFLLVFNVVYFPAQCTRMLLSPIIHFLCFASFSVNAFNLSWFWMICRILLLDRILFVKVFVHICCTFLENTSIHIYQASMVTNAMDKYIQSFVYNYCTFSLHWNTLLLYIGMTVFVSLPFSWFFAAFMLWAFWPITGASKDFRLIFWNKLLLLRSEVEIRGLVKPAWSNPYFRGGGDYRFWKRCTVHGIRAIPCDWGLRGTISLVLSTCQTYYKKSNV